MTQRSHTARSAIAQVLSVVAQQVSEIQAAVRARAATFVFEGTQLALRPSCNAFVTMNPGWAGRGEVGLARLQAQGGGGRRRPTQSAMAASCCMQCALLQRTATATCMHGCGLDVPRPARRPDWSLS